MSGPGNNRTKPTALAASVCLALLGASRGTHAAEPAASRAAPQVAVLPLAVEGKLFPHTISAVEQSSVKGLAGGDFDVIAPRAVRKAHADAAACSDAACFETVASKTHAAHIVRFHVVVEQGRDFVVRAELIDGADGSVVTSAEDTCEICGQEELIEVVDSQVAKLRERLDVIHTAPPSLAVATAPAGATVTVDGKPQGTTPLELPVSAGRHKVEVAKPGYVAQRREVELASGGQERLSIDLQSEDSDIPQWIGWTVLGAGVGTLGGGVAMLVLDERPKEHKCSGNNVDSDGDCKFLYDTLIGGAVLTATGVALVAAGVTLAVVSRKRSSKSKRRARFGPGPYGLALSF